jgi:hypothetical protein
MTSTFLHVTTTHYGLHERIHATTLKSIVIILLVAVNKTNTPVVFVEGELRIRCLEELKTGESFAVQALRIRLVCHHFHKLSWRAFGHVIGRTFFNIRSRDGFTNLLQVSRCADLSPWVRRRRLNAFW